MRQLADAERIGRFMRELGRAAEVDGACYLTGGATAVLVGWRASTVDVVIRLVPESDGLLRAIPSIKERLEINVELAAADDFLPIPAGWDGRSLFVATEGRLSFYHFDPYSQALAKLERAHEQDLRDVRAMVERRLVDPARGLDSFDEIEPELYRFPSVDPRAFRRRVEEAFGTTL